MQMIKKKSAAGAASKTYRYAVNKLAETIGVEASHTRYPRDDFEDMLGQVDDQTVEKAIKWYKVGIRRGMTKVIELLLSQKLKSDGEIIIAPSVLSVKTFVRFKGHPRRICVCNVKATELGFKIKAITPRIIYSKNRRISQPARGATVQ